MMQALGNAIAFTFWVGVGAAIYYGLKNGA